MTVITYMISTILVWSLKSTQAAQMASIVLTHVPEDLLFLNTMPQQLSCLTKGFPQPTVTWIKENSIVQPKDGVLTIKDGTLYFNSFNPTEYDKSIHDTKYRCKVSNAVGSIISREIKVKAVIDNRYSPIVYHQSTPIGGTAIFKCHLPPGSKKYIKVYSWKAIYPGGAKKRTILSGMTVDGFHALMSGELIITDVTKAYQEFQFSCVSQNVLSNVTLQSSPARLFPNEPVDFPIREIVFPTNRIVYEGETITLECEATSYPFPKITWYKDDVILDYNDRIKSITGGSIRILKANLNDIGTYTCKIGYKDKTRELKANVTVKVPMAIKTAPSLVAIQDGRAANFKCEATGTEPIIIEWRKNGVLLTNSNRLSIIPNTLVVFDSSINDEGIYQCVIRNRFDEIQTSARLIVGAVLPLIESPPVGKTLSVGSQVSMTCKCTGQPSPNIFWWYDGKLVQESEDHMTIVTTKDTLGIVTSVLLIRDVQTKHSGPYKCLASNRVGDVEASGEINIEGKPVITDFASEITGMSGKPLIIPCKGKGFPKIKTSWFKNGIELQSTDRIFLLPDGSLSFKLFRKGDIATYWCEVENSNGKDKKEVKVDNLDRPRITPFSLQPTLVGDRAQYLCTTQDKNNFEITWYKDGIEASQVEGIKVIDLIYSKALTFGKVTTKHAGRYTCAVENDAGKATYSADFIIYEKPVFQSLPVATSVLNSHPIMLSCSASGFPQPQITWYKKDMNGQDKPVILDHRIRQLNNGTLYIGVSQAIDNGRYVCKASFFDNKLVPDPLFKEVKVEVRVPARVIGRSPYEAREMKTKSIHLACSSSGTPMLTIKWFKNGLIISEENNAKYQIYSTLSHALQPPVYNSTLQISSLINADNGIYECLATNPFGSQKADFKVLVEEKPSHPKNMEEYASTSRNIQVKWIPGYDGNSKVISYKIEMKEKSKSWNAGHYFIVNGNKTTYIVANLKAGMSYSFRISAENKHGTSGRSNEYTFNTKEEAPSGAPLNVTVSSLSKEKILVEWQAPELSKRNGIIIDYRINFYQTISQNKIKHNVTTSLTNHFILDGLRPYTTYTIQVQALTRQGGGPLSDGNTATTLEGVPTSAPTSLQTQAVNSHTILVSWNRVPTEKINGILQGYKILYIDVDEGKTYEKMVFNALETQLTKLKKFALYKICVLAFTKAGDGVISDYAYKRTEEDTPDRPADFSVTPNTPSEILVAWNPPLSLNGIISNYILYYKEFGESIRHRIVIHRDSRSQMLRNLAVGKDYVIWMTAKTSKGEGDSTKKITSKTEDHVAAKIMTPSGWTVTAQRGQDVVLPCLAIGFPKPSVQWKKPPAGASDSTQKNKRWLAEDRPFKLFNIDQQDEGMYNCTAVNTYGFDWNAVALIVQVPPSPPAELQAHLVAHNAINVTWIAGTNGHSPITLNHINYAVDGQHDNWMRKTVSSDQKWFVLVNVTRDVAYFQVASENSVGIGYYSPPLKFVITGNDVDILPVTKVFAAMQKDSSTEDIRKILQPVLISVVAIATILLILLFIASWDKEERRMRKPRCRRLCCLSCCCKCKSKSDYANEPYSEPGLLWPWHNVKSTRVSGNYDYNMTDELLSSTDDQISFRYHKAQYYDKPLNKAESKKSIASASNGIPHAKEIGRYQYEANTGNMYEKHSGNAYAKNYEPVVLFKPTKTPESSISYKSDTASKKSSISSKQASIKMPSYEEVYERPPPMIERYLRSQEVLNDDYPKQYSNNYDNFNNPDNYRDSIMSEDSVDLIIKEVTEKIGLNTTRGIADGNSSVDFRKSPPEYQDIISNYKNDAPRVLLRRDGGSPGKRGRRNKLNRKSIDSLILKTLESIEEQKMLANGTTGELSLPQAASIIREMLGTSKSYDSVSSTCSSSVGELKRAFEFGKKYGLQTYDIPSFDLPQNGLEEDESEELDYDAHEILLDTLNLAEFSEKPRDMNDMKVQIPLPVRLTQTPDDAMTSGEEGDIENSGDENYDISKFLPIDDDMHIDMGNNVGQSFV